MTLAQVHELQPMPDYPRELDDGDSRGAPARRPPPYDAHAELCVLSACMFTGASAAEACRALVRPEDFYEESHRRIFEAISELATESQTVDITSVGAWLSDRGRLLQVGGAGYLIDVLNSAPALTRSRLESYASTIAAKAVQRSKLAIVQRAEARLYLGIPGAETSEFLDELVIDLRAEDDRLARPAPPPWAERAQAVPPEWCVDAPPARTWLLRDARTGRGSLPLGKAGMLLAEGGAGKTTLLCQLALSVATGEPFLDWIEVVTPGPVLLLMGEEERDDVQRQIHRAAQSRGIRLEPGRIVVLPLHGVPCAMLERDRDGNVRDTPFAEWLFGYLRDKRFALAVLDPVSRFAGLEAETDNAQATRYVQSTERIGTLCGASVINSHHTNKTSRGGAQVTSSSSRGSSAFTDGHRWVATLTLPDLKTDDDASAPTDEVVTFSISKNNYELRGLPLTLRRTKTGALEPMDDHAAAAVRRAQTGETARQAKRSKVAEERSQAQRARDLEDAKRREEREAHILAVRQARDAEDDDAVRRLRKENPMATSRELVALLKKAQACGTDRAHDAVIRATASVSCRPDPADPVDPAKPLILATSSHEGEV